MDDTDEWQARMVLAHTDLEAELDALRKERARDTELILNARLGAQDARDERDALRERIKTLAATVRESEGGGLYVGPGDILALLGRDDL